MYLSVLSSAFSFPTPDFCRIQTMGASSVEVLMAFMPSTCPRAFFEEQLQCQVIYHYWTLAISYRGLGALNGAYQSRSLNIPFGLQEL